MKRNIKIALITLSAGLFGILGGGCGGSWFWRMLGDAVGDTFAYNIFLD
jgi:hypothetical protein